MPYTAEITRSNPSCILILIDQSKSMSGSFGDLTGTTKADYAAYATNRLLQNLIIKCCKNDGVRDYWHVGVIGYGQKVASALPQPLNNGSLVPISLLANNPRRLEHQTVSITDLLEQSIIFPIWVDVAAGGTAPMCEALRLSIELLESFLVRSPHCFPPVVINISDGEVSDGDPEPHAQLVRDLASEDGNVLLYNVNISGQDKPILFPSRENDLPDDLARMLFRMSSFLPTAMQKMLQSEGHQITETTRGFVYNGDPIALIRFMDIGTRPSYLR